MRRWSRASRSCSTTGSTTTSPRASRPAQRAAGRVLAGRSRADHHPRRADQVARRVERARRPPAGEQEGDRLHQRARLARCDPVLPRQAVAMAAYERGFREAAAPIIEPTNASRKLVRQFLTDCGYRFIMGDGGYYAFVNVATGWTPPGWATASPGRVSGGGAWRGSGARRGVFRRGQPLDPVFVRAAARRDAGRAETLPRGAERAQAGVSIRTPWAHQGVFLSVDYRSAAPGAAFWIR